MWRAKKTNQRSLACQYMNFNARNVGTHSKSLFSALQQSASCPAQIVAARIFVKNYQPLPPKYLENLVFPSEALLPLAAQAVLEGYLANPAVGRMIKYALCMDRCRARFWVKIIFTNCSN
jgi:hypothetical protein